MGRHYSPGIQEHDKKKEQSCYKMGITLIMVPYWWDGKLSSLATTIHNVRPDISLPSTWITSPIPDSVPEAVKTLRMYCDSDVNVCSAL